VSITGDQLYQEEIDLIVSTFGASASDEQLRDDEPRKRLSLKETREAKARLQDRLNQVTRRERVLTAELLTDGERQRLAQIARDLRDGTMPDVDADVPVTRCPDWCEVEAHAETREGRLTHHEGAMSSWHVRSYEGERVMLGVYLEEDGTPVCNLQSNAALPLEDIDRLIGDAERAKQLVVRIGGEQ
jgi:hypothetical protein